MKTAEDLVHEKGGKIISVSDDTCIHDALKLMIRKKSRIHYCHQRQSLCRHMDVTGSDA